MQRHSENPKKTLIGPENPISSSIKPKIYKNLKGLLAKTEEPISDSTRILQLVGKALVLFTEKYPSKCPEEVPKIIEATEPPPAAQTDDAVVIALQNLGTASPRQVAQATGLSLPTVQRRLRALIEEGTVTKQGSTRSVLYEFATTSI